MNNLIYFIFGVVVGGAVVFLFTRKQGSADVYSKKLIDTQANEKEAHKQSIMEAFATKERLTNNEVEKLLHVSDATATRYLDDLEKEGKVRQVGETGAHVYYEKNI